jgi:hypothetical protein
MSFSSPNPSRDQSPARLSLSHSRYLDSPAGQNLSDGESEQDEDEEEPVELNEFEMDAINSRVGSGAVTPAVGSSRPYPVVAAGLPRQKESRVVSPPSSNTFGSWKLIVLRWLCSGLGH